MKEKYEFEITPEGEVISENGAPMKEIFIAYLKMKSPVVVLTVIVLFLIYSTINKETTVLIKSIKIFSAFLSILLFRFLNKKPEQNIKKEGNF